MCAIIGNRFTSGDIMCRRRASGYVGGKLKGLPQLNKRSLIFLASVIAFGLAGTSARAEDGVTKDRIVFGQVAALEGPAQALGQGMRQGLLAAFAEVNRAGGVAGRKLELKSADDGYEPQKTIDDEEDAGRRKSVRDRRC